MKTLSRRMGTLTLCALVTPFVVAGAQTESRGWNLCSLGTIQACNRISITTTPMVQNLLRVGTSVFMTVQNLQGTDPFDNTGGSAVYGAVFLFDNAGPPSCSGLCWDLLGVSGAPVGTGASGAGEWNFEGGVDNGGFPPSGFFSSEDTAPIQGCVPGSYSNGLVGTLATCGSFAHVSFSVNTTLWIDAKSITGGEVETLTHNADFIDCRLSGVGGGGRNACAVQEVTASPEPGTFLLLGTSLSAFAGIGWRRRNRVVEG